MLKWLRKYNTLILVVGGCLLMIAFLLGGILPDLGRRGFLGGTIFRGNDFKIGAEAYSVAAREHAALDRMIGNPQMLAAIGGGETVEHWILLSKEAERGGFIGGTGDGQEYVPVLSRRVSELFVRQQMMNNPFISPEQIEQFIDQSNTQQLAGMTTIIERLPSEAGITKDQIYKALAKLRGVVRMREAYMMSSRFGDRRLTMDARNQEDSAEIEYVIVPPERAMTGISEPDEAAINAHFAKFKDTPQGGGDFGIGYTLQPRVKVAYLEVDRTLISSLVTADAIEVEKRFLARFPNGRVPEGMDAAGERRKVENDVQRESVDRIMKLAEQAVRSEVDKAVRKLDVVGDFRMLTKDWATTGPDYTKIRDIVVQRVKELAKLDIPTPRVMVRDQGWLDRQELSQLEGIGNSFVSRGQRRDGFADVVMSVRELSETGNDLSFQVGIPLTEPLLDARGHKYFITVLDSRKTSPPDTIAEIRSDIVTNVKRLAAFEQLKTKVEALKAQGVAGGLTAITAAPEGATGEAAKTLSVERGMVSRQRFGGLGGDPRLDVESFRNTVVDHASSLDPTKDIATLDASQRTFATTVDRVLGVVVYQFKRLSPLTAERYRARQTRLINQLTFTELRGEGRVDPFSLKAMEERMGVKYEDGRSKPEPKAEEKKSQTS